MTLEQARTLLRTYEAGLGGSYLETTGNSTGVFKIGPSKDPAAVVSR